MTSPVLRAALAYAKQGVSIVLLRSRSKAPVEREWATAPFLTPDEVHRRWKGHNIGVRLGEPSKIGRLYLHAFDLDIRDPRRAGEAWDALLEVLPDAEKCAAVVSGSGGESRHLYFLSDKPFRKRNIARSKAKVETPDGPKRAWEIDLYGTGAQIVLPPSIHPVTEREYRWIDGAAPDFTKLPHIPSDEIARAVEGKNVSRREERAEREPFPLDDLERVLFEVPFYDNRDGGLDYDDWRDVVFAVHHQYSGTDDEEEAYALLEDWSSESDKHSDEELYRVYNAIHGEDEREVRVTIASLAKRLHDHDADPKVRRSRWEKEGISFSDERERAREIEREDEARRERQRALEREIAEAEERGEGHPDAWRKNVATDGNGEPIFTPDALVRVLSAHPMFSAILRSDAQTHAPTWVYAPEFKAECLRFGLSPKHPFTPYDRDTHYIAVHGLLANDEDLSKWPKKKGFTKGLVNDCVMLAAQNGLRKFNWMEHVFFKEKWDGEARVERLFIDYLGAEDDAAGYARAAARHLCLTIAGRIITPGMKADEVVILQGPQGCGKDTFIDNLVGFSGCDLVQSDLSELQSSAHYGPMIEGRAIVHFSEMHAMSKANQSRLKAFITATVDSYTPKYVATPRQVRRTFAIVATTNDDFFLPDDPTGLRRYLPIVCGDPKRVVGENGEIIYSGYRKNSVVDLPKERAQIWAEARQMLHDAKVTDILRMPATATAHLNKVRPELTIMTGEQDIAADVEQWLGEPRPLEVLLGKNRIGSTDDPDALYLRGKFTRREAWDAVMNEPGTHYDPHDVRFTRALQRVKGFKAARSNGKRFFKRIETNGRPLPVNHIEKESVEERVVRFDDARRRRIL